MAAPNDFMAGVKLTAGPIDQQRDGAITNLPGIGADTTIDRERRKSPPMAMSTSSRLTAVIGTDFINVTN